MASTTVKLSMETRDRIKALGGATHEETIIEALDLLEAERFWADAESAAAWRRGCSDEDRTRLGGAEAGVDAAFDSVA